MKVERLMQAQRGEDIKQMRTQADVFKVRLLFKHCMMSVYAMLAVDRGWHQKAAMGVSIG
jgi:hypothetical protein